MTNPTKTLHVAWTIDDGPLPPTPDMMEVFKKRKIPATWYIQRNSLTTAWIGKYKELQNQYGHEIAIHGIHPKKDHLSYFPSGKLPSFTTMEDACKNLRDFHAYLTSVGLKTKFIRLPYGLWTEVNHRLSMLKSSADENSIIRGEPQKDPGAKTVAKELGSLESQIKKLGLHLWGGKKTDTISAMSWECETAAKGTGRTDNVPAIPDKMMKVSLDSRQSKTGSLVILCHDRTAKDVAEVASDIEKMTITAKATGTTIKYHTMSSLFKTVVGKTP